MCACPLGLAKQTTGHWYSLRHCARKWLPPWTNATLTLRERGMPTALVATVRRPRLPCFCRHRKMPSDVPVPEVARWPMPALSRHQNVYLRAAAAVTAARAPGAGAIHVAHVQASCRGHAWRSDGGTPHNGLAIATTTMPLVRWLVGTLHRIDATYTAPPKTDLRGRTAWRHASSLRKASGW